MAKCVNRAFTRPVSCVAAASNNESPAAMRPSFDFAASTGMWISEPHSSGSHRTRERRVNNYFQGTRGRAAGPDPSDESARGTVPGPDSSDK